MSFEQRRFGKYVLLDRLAEGGMAEVFLGKLTGAESFERLLAIKCMKPELIADDEFIDMFIAEARLAGQLSHPNVVQIFELGKFEDQLYIAMELIEGRDLGDIVEVAEREGREIPVGFAAYVLAQAALGLDYAHRKVDEHGSPLGIIHRDVTPRNVMVSWQGAVKVVDFGIAKAAGHGTKTRVGVLKGKFNYLAPEQVQGTDLDRRADVFNLGNVLYEVLSGKKMYVGESDFEILDLAKRAERPDFVAAFPELPEELVAILQKATAPKRQERYEFASDFAKAMDPLLITGRSIFGAPEAGRFMEDLYRTEREEARARAARALDALMDRDIEDSDEDFSTRTQTFMSAFKAPEVPSLPKVNLDPGGFSMPGQDSEPAGGYSMPGQSPRGAAGLDDETTGLISREVRPRARGGGLSRPWVWGGIVLAMVALGLGAVLGLGLFEAAPLEPEPTVAEPEPEPEPTFGYLRIKARRARGAVLFVDDMAMGKLSKQPVRLPTGIHEIRLEKKGKVLRATVTVGEEHTRRRPAVIKLKF